MHPVITPSGHVSHVKLFVTEPLLEPVTSGPYSIDELAATKAPAVENIFDAIIQKIPAPEDRSSNPLRAMIFDSVHDNYKGAIPYIRVFDGVIKPGDKAKFFAHNSEYDITEVGHFVLKQMPSKELKAGDVGYFLASIRDVSHILPGDTVTSKNTFELDPLPGFKEIKPMVFSGLYPSDADDYDQLRIALEKLKLNDASLLFEPETSEALGFGFRCGFLGLLHMEIIQERLEREFDIALVPTTPNVRYKIEIKNGKMIEVDTPSKMPPTGEIQSILEPYVSAEIITPKDYIGGIMKLCQKKRGIYKNTNYITADKAQLHYELPLGEIIFDFFDKLKSTTKGYASLDYHMNDYVSGDLKKLDILINHEPVDALSIIIHAEDAYHRGVALCSKLKELIPRQMFDVPIQAALGNKVISRSTVKAVKKNVTAKCYGGDITRKRKLWEKQKEGKKRMKSIGKVEIPQEALLAVLQIDSD